MEKLELCVVQDSYVDVECTQYAHVYFPGAVWAEKEGCFTNTERRVNITRPIAPPFANSKPDAWIFSQLAKRWEQGRRMRFPETSEGIFEEMKALSKLGKGLNGRERMLDISGMSYDLIEQSRGIQWPMREGDEGGSPRLYTDGIFQFPDGKARLLAMPYIENNEKPCSEFPLWLNSGRVVEHFHTRTKTGKVGNCNKFSPTPYMEINPDAAHELGVQHMEYVRLVSRRGDAVVMAQLTQRVPHNMVFIPFHFHDCVNRLTLGLLDPHSRQPAFKQCSVRIEKTDQEEAARLNVQMRKF
jgi:assimilatory nitrate reductase catalytic subunit